MDNLKSFIKKYKNELLIALGACSSIVASIATMEGTDAGICSILIAIIAVVIGALQHGFSESTITLIAKAIQIIIEEVNNSESKNEGIVSASAKIEETISIDEIKRRLLE